MRKLFAAAGAIGLSLGLMWAGAGAASAEELNRRVAVCQNRLCLLVLGDSTDNDGDGVTDVDEQALGTDPKDPESRPDVQQIFDEAIARELPSFEKHLTELVALPKNTPDGAHLATAFGALDRPSQGAVVKSVGGLLHQVNANGFENVRDDVTAILTRPPLADEAEKLVFALRGNVALYGSEIDGVVKVEGIVGPTTYGLNGAKTPTGISDGGFTYGADAGSIGHRYSVRYEDASWDEVSSSSTFGNGSTSAMTDVTSYGSGGRRSGNTTVVTDDGYTQTKGTVTTTGYDDDGNLTQSGRTEYTYTDRQQDDGSHVQDTAITTTNYDKDGKQTDRSTIDSTTTTSADGTTTTKTTTTTYDGDDNVTGRTETTTTESSDGTTTTTTTTYDANGNVVSTQTTTDTCDGCQTDGDSDGFVDPDYVGVGAITGEDLARVDARLNSIRTPSQDDYGQIDLSDVKPPVSGADPMVALVNPDGVVSLAVGGNPTFNRAQPDYRPELQDIIDISGVTPPNSTDPVSWP